VCLVHEMGNRVTAALIAFSLLQKGVVGISGSTGAVLGRSLRALRFLVNNSLAEVRLEAGLGLKERVSINELISEIRSEGAMVADATGVDFAVLDVEAGVHVQGDPQILSAAISNLLQNAFKFSRARHARVSQDHGHAKTVCSSRSKMSVAACPQGKSTNCSSRSSSATLNRTGLGLGLTISSKGVAAMGGKMGARDLPGKGCVFWIDLPRIPAN
jgi:signal transduction histidine kinase